jgi:cytidylate kinase
MIITIDGSAGSGKTAAALRLAERLGFRLLNTGAMYRAAGLRLLRAGIDPFAEPRDAERIGALVAGLRFDLTNDRVRVDGEDITDDLFTAAMGPVASRVATFPEVRTPLKAEQRRIAAAGDFVCEGRDQGTSVFPHAEVKFFLSASAEVRADRRLGQLREKGETADRDELLAQIRARDEQDTTRALDPLAKAPDAIAVDTSRYTLDEVVEHLWDAVRHYRSKARPGG